MRKPRSAGRSGEGSQRKGTIDPHKNFTRRVPGMKQGTKPHQVEKGKTHMGYIYTDTERDRRRVGAATSNPELGQAAQTRHIARKLLVSGGHRGVALQCRDKGQGIRDKGDAAQSESRSVGIVGFLAVGLMAILIAAPVAARKLEGGE